MSGEKPDTSATSCPKPSEEGKPPSSDIDGTSAFVRCAEDDRRSGEHRFSMAHSFACARAGVAYAFRTQRNLKIDLAFAAAAVALGFLLGISQADWLAIILCIAFVMALELVNTAIESVVDMAQPTWHKLAMHAKDCAAGAVYLAALASVVVAAVVYLPQIWNLAMSAAGA